jgi:hypothetical protein
VAAVLGTDVEVAEAATEEALVQLTQLGLLDTPLVADGSMNRRRSRRGCRSASHRNTRREARERRHNDPQSAHHRKKPRTTRPTGTTAAPTTTADPGAVSSGSGSAPKFTG